MLTDRLDCADDPPCLGSSFPSPLFSLRPATRVDPLARPVDIRFTFPDRNPLLELLDHVPARVVCRTPMWMCDGDHDARVPELENADAVLDDDVARSELERRLAHNVRHLALGH